jgi:hypothetical protein
LTHNIQPALGGEFFAFFWYSITLHLREDRRHIQDEDVVVLREKLTTKMNLEMASTDEMIAIPLSGNSTDIQIITKNCAPNNTVFLFSSFWLSLHFPSSIDGL